MDRNSVIGFALLAALLIGYITYNNYSQKEYKAQKQADSIAKAKVHPMPAKVDTAATTTAIVADATVLDSTIVDNRPAAYTGEAKEVTLENDQIAITFNTNGAHPKKALLKEYKTHSGEPLYLFDGAYNKLSAVLPINNGAVATGDLFYEVVENTDADGAKSLTFTADLGDGKLVKIKYALPATGYMLQYNMDLDGMPVGGALPFTWQTEALHTENDIKNERINSQIYYRYTNEDHDYYTISNKEDEKESLESKTNWIGFRLHFFTNTIISDEGFNNAVVIGKTKLDSDNIVAQNKNTFDVPFDAATQSASLRFYIGPNHYKTLRSYKIGMEEMVPLGYGPMFFVKYINKWLIIPIFNILSSFISNYGVIIMLMTIIIRLLLSFFTYKSYLSAAKMRVLKPELDELREECGEDKQKFGVEQMKLYKQAGVNPLGGCLPTLFQLPILFAMYYFFPSSIELRQESFLWASDLSTYDSIASWTSTIPVLSSVYGNHISLFTILMTISSLFLALYNRNMTAQDPNNPMLKWMPFIFPIFLLGIFNKMAAALTFYYFFSNMISIAQQFIIQKYIINEDAIHAQIQENKNKPAKESKWQQRLQEMQKAQMEKAKQQQKKK
ncbi:MAG: membrane protein insertase YidC [Flavipsychrobacter sp.]